MKPHPRSRILAGLALGLTLTALAGCAGDTTAPPTRREISVFGYLYVGEAITEENALRISEVRPIDDYYDPAEAAISGAVVTLQKHGGAPDTLPMVRPGYYANPEVVIDSQTSYDLRVLIPGRAPISATTATPTAFVTHREPRVLPGSMRIGDIPDSFTIALSCENPEQMLLLDVYCQENWQDARYIDPPGSHDHPDDYDEYGKNNGEPRHNFGYFRFKNLEKEGDDRLVNFYDAMMVFYGRYTVTLLAMDDNYYRYLYLDHPEENGGIVGGIGVFGSACRTQYQVRVTP
jgi:hypothetical protein